jgi:HSP20 family protein
MEDYKMKLVRFNNSYLPSVFDGFFGNEYKNWGYDSESFRSTLPSVNVKESEDGYELEVAAPGLKKDDFKINLEKDVLTISSEKKEEKTDNKGYTRKEFSYTSFERSFTLPENKVDYDKVSAKYEDGVLRIGLPKREEAKVKPARAIEIA